MDNLEKFQLEDIIGSFIAQGNIPKIENLIDSSKDSTVKRFGYKLLCLTAEIETYSISPRAENFETFNLLLKKNCPVNDASDKYRDSPLISAVKSNKTEVVEMLLNSGAEIDKMNLFCQNSFDIASSNDNEEILRLLIDHVSDNNITDRSYMRLLANLFKQDFVDLIEKLLTKCLHINIVEAMTSYNYLKNAVETKQYKIIELLLKRGVDINYVDYLGHESETALYTACSECNLEMVKFLLKHGANPNLKVPFCNGIASYNEGTFHPIHVAARENNIDILDALLNHGANINEEGFDKRKFTALSIIVEISTIDVVKFLVDKGADIYWKDGQGRLLIEKSVTNGNRDVLGYLLTKQDNQFNSIHVERLFRSLAQWFDSDTEHIDTMISYLQQLKPESPLRYHVDSVLFKNRIHRPLLHVIIKRSSTTFIKPLIDYGADVNFVNTRGRTPLHTAFQCRILPSIKVLIEYGAGINLICDDGYTPLDYALEDQLYENRKTDDEDCDEFGLEVSNPIDDIVDYFTQHILKLRLVNLQVTPKNYDDLISRSDDAFRNQKAYKKEVDKMKNVFITKDVSYYDVVTANLYKMVAYLKDDLIFKTLKSENYQEEFPLYKTIIKGCFCRGFQRLRLLKEVSVYPDFDMIFNLPYPCMRNVMKYFSNGDLKDFLLKAHCPDCLMQMSDV